MIKDFFRYSKNFFKYRLFRIIIYIFIAFLIFSFCKLKSHASTISGATATVYTQTQNCDIDSSDQTKFACQKGTTFKFIYDVNNTSNTSDFSPFILTSDKYIYFKNLVISYELASPITIDSTHRSIYVKFQNGAYLSTSTNDGELQINQNWISTTPVVDNQEDQRYKIPANYSFKPYYCNYIDSNGVTKTCGVIFEHTSATTNNFYMVFDIPTGEAVKKINLFLGNYTFNTSYNVRTLVSGTSIKVPSSTNFLYTEWIGGRSNFSTYRVNYNTYRQTTNDSQNTGIYWLLKGVTYRDPKFKVPNVSDELNYDSNNYTSNSYKYYFNSYSSDLKDQLNNSLSVMEQETEEQQEDNELSDLMNGFIDSDEASSFTNLFSSIFTYPLNKLRETTNEPLFDDSPTGVNLAVCTGRGFIGDVDQDRIQIPTINGVKWDIPCLHYDIYTKLHNDTTGFYPTSIDGHNITSGRSTSFYLIYRTILRGVLIYIMFLNIIDIYKYILDSDRKEIETIDL